MYVPAWPPLAPVQLLRRTCPEARCFPFDVRNATYFYRARNAIYHLFRALHFQAGDTVLVPDYHSGNEVWAIRAAGASVAFYPVRRDLSLDLDAVRRLCRNYHPRALFVIHYLGWPQPMNELMSLCRERGMLLIEDCALSLFSEYHGHPLGSLGDYAVFCLYKTLPVPNGGMLVQNRRVLEEISGVELQPCGFASAGTRTVSMMLEWIRARADLLGRALDTVKGALGRGLDALHVHRVPIGDIGFDPAQVNLQMSPVSRGLLPRFDGRAIRRKRRENYRLLRERLPQRIQALPRDLDDGVCPLLFPVLVRDKHAVTLELQARGVAAVEFWNFGDPEARREGAAGAQYLREHLIGLPIHQELMKSQVEYIARCVAALAPAP